MTHQAILEKAISKAIAGGWLSGADYSHYVRTNPDQVGLLFYPDDDRTIEWHDWEWLIFNHDFARALWPETEEEWQPTSKEWDKYGLWYYDGGYMPDFSGQEWEWHLQNMVIADDPIKYLGESQSA
jgi:hypothetical protein